ncbi:helix-turn-helix domain-containing protein [Variovorax paradoxus]|uniref:helix-turn-helix domain-containing protein n=1 Tax=Variovorax paradoxus TaxID=34073 RepID=UPI0039B119A8
MPPPVARAEAGDGRDLASADELRALLQRHRWHVARAAAELGVCRATVYRHMKRHGIAPPQRM